MDLVSHAVVKDGFLTILKMITVKIVAIIGRNIGNLKKYIQYHKSGVLVNS
jgi:hypothetical protein